MAVATPTMSRLYKNLIDSGIPVVMVDRYVPELACAHVIYDNETASYKLTEKLLGRGHETIAVLLGQEGNTTAVGDRLRGHHQARGIDYHEELVWLDLYNHYLPQEDALAESPHLGYQAQLRGKLERYRPTAVFTINDLIANHLVHDLLRITAHKRAAHERRALGARPKAANSSSPPSALTRERTTLT